MMEIRVRPAGAWWLVTALLLLAEGQAAGTEEPARNTCINCHLALEDTLKAPVQAFTNDVHNQAGLGCVACHGGDAMAEDALESMDPAKGFRGVPAIPQIPELCGGCHQEATFIKQFAPNLPTDQLAQYRTSVHGQRIAAGDDTAATCVSCHGAHGIFPVRDTRSSVYPTRVVGTCAACHADPQRMAPYKIPTTQVADYEQSVHYRALTTLNDRSAPTCTSCHGSHGAAPPGVESVVHVCGTCHSRNMELFRSSPHRAAFSAKRIGACAACHSNHRVVAPQDTWLRLEGDGVCGRCHKREDRGGTTAIGMFAALQLAARTLELARDQVGRAEKAGMLMEDADGALRQARDELTTARADVHTASLAAMAVHTDASTKAADQALAEARTAFDEIRYRRSGLLVALALIVLSLIALALMIRQIERPPASPRQ